MLVKVIGLVLPLGLDTFAVAAALGIAGLPRGQRLRVSLLFTAFEMGMPLVGLLGGGIIGGLAGGIADYLAIAILIGLGAFMLRPEPEQKHASRAALLMRTHGLQALALGISISLDELAIGFTLGLLRLPVALLIVVIGAQAFVATQLGIRLGVHLGERLRQGAERLAGLALLVLGLFLLIEKLAR